MGSKSVVQIVVGLILMIVFLAVIAGVSVAFSKWNCGNDGYGLVFDAGSSHTSMAVYKWPGDTTNGTGVVSQEVYIGDCGEEGISYYADNPSLLKPGLEQCLDSATEAVPEQSVASTPVYLAATAGMRLLHETDPDKSDAVFDSVREVLRESPFAFEDEEKHWQASILSGEREAYSGWITVNYLAKNLGVTPAIMDVISETLWGTPIPRLPSLGALDLGGASTQITFAPKDPSTVPDENKVKLRLYGTDYELYTHSYGCYGANEARRRMEANLIKDSNFSSVIENPCAPKNRRYTLDGAYLWKAPCSTGPQALAGWGSEVTPAPAALENSDAMDTMEYEFLGTGNGTQCVLEAQKLFNFSAPCANPPCSFNGVHSPEPYGSFVAMSGLSYTAGGIGVPANASREEWVTARDEYCIKTYEEVEALPGQIRYNVNYCFQASYIGVLLDAFRFEDWDLEFALKINGVDIGWALGFMIDLTSRIPAEASCMGLSPVAFYVILALSIIFILVGVVLVALGCSGQMRKDKDMGDQPKV